tara:strand:+ start:170 stop:1168 length:999 start_codon:yes stop_codon:yes gene_type:complete
LVSSGAVAAGRQVLKKQEEKNPIAIRQVLAATGQIQLMNQYTAIFNQYDIPIAQALLTRKDVSDRLSYLNIRNTLINLLEMDILPIINENDVVAIEEIENHDFGDNDNLSALVSNLIDADLLIILGKTKGVFTSDPNIDPKAKFLMNIDLTDSNTNLNASGPSDTKGRGGMATKLQAAKLATSSGTNVIICNGLEPNILLRLAKGEQIGSLISATNSKLESRKRWMISNLTDTGFIQIDNGAKKALLNGNTSLLPAGIINIQGSFDRGDIVSIYDNESKLIAAGISNYNALESNRIQGKHSTEILTLLGHHYGDEVIHRNNMVIINDKDVFS